MYGDVRGGTCRSRIARLGSTIDGSLQSRRLEREPSVDRTWRRRVERSGRQWDPERERAPRAVVGRRSRRDGRRVATSRLEGVTGRGRRPSGASCARILGRPGRDMLPISERSDSGSHVNAVPEIRHDFAREATDGSLRADSSTTPIRVSFRLAVATLSTDERRGPHAVCGSGRSVSTGPLSSSIPD